ncbi:MAG: VWA domain-containing protein [Gemmatimonadota bacterium]|nr:VWA domain-containing protein [Gemmatimonadota bacterium]
MTWPGAIAFYTPQALWLLLLLPAWWAWRRSRRPDAIVFSQASVLARGPRSGSWIPRAIFLLRNLAIALLVVTLARPRAGAKVENLTSQGINIVLAIDLSSSMLAQDFQPQNRIQVAKATVKSFIAGRRSDRIGIVAFAGEALTQVPLTTDYAVVTQAVDNLQAGQLEDGTAIGTALATAANRLRDAPGKSKVLVLLTDGISNRGNVDARTAAQAASAYGIKIYTIGVGTQGSAPVPIGRGSDGRLIFQMQPVELDEVMLSDIARMSGGRYFRARDAAALQSIYQQIDRLERAPVQSRTVVRYAELFRWPLTLGILALIGELFLVAWKAPLP